MPETTVDRKTTRRRAATAMAATSLVGDVACRLGAHGIDVMPVKGALLQHWVYEDPSQRAMTDVDVLVRGGEVERAARILETAGYRRTPHRSVGGVVMLTPFGLPLDLHPEPFDRARYRLSAEALFSRSTGDDALYGATVRLPSALDVYAHLIGKLGSDQQNARSEARLDEIARVGRLLGASPATTAHHLVASGMGRVARYALPLVHRVCDDRYALEVRMHLPFDPVGDAVAAAARLVLGRATPPSLAGAVAAHLLNESIPRGVRSGVRGMLIRRR